MQTHLAKHGAHGIALGKENVRVKMMLEPYEDLLTYVYI